MWSLDSSRKYSTTEIEFPKQLKFHFSFNYVYVTSISYWNFRFSALFIIFWAQTPVVFPEPSWNFDNEWLYARAARVINGQVQFGDILNSDFARFFLLCYTTFLWKKNDSQVINRYAYLFIHLYMCINMFLCIIIRDHSSTFWTSNAIPKEICIYMYMYIRFNNWIIQGSILKSENRVFIMK